MSPFTAEVIGTFLLILLGGGVVANVVLKKTKSNDQGWMVITTGWGLAVFTGVVVAGPYSGAHLNPAVSIGLALAGEFDWISVPSYIIAQFIGAMAGAILVWIVYKDHFDITDDGETKKAVFCTSPAIRNPGINLVSEIVGTFVLVFAVLYFSDPTIGDSQTPVGLGSIGAIPVAFIVWVIGLSLGGTTGYAINPARDLGPRIIYAILPIKNKGSIGWNYAIIPIVGPIAGSGIAAFLMLILQ